MEQSQKDPKEAEEAAVEGETKWTDDRIRWTEDADKHDDDGDDDEEEESAFIDPFKDPNPQDTFDFQFVVNDTTKINLEIQGYKKDADQVWRSTGLTLWRASEHLCQYLVQNANILQGKKLILELGAGLGLVGILAHHLAEESTVCITDGDTDALVQLRDNIRRNKVMGDNNNRKVSAHQLIWGRETTKFFSQQRQKQQEQQQELPPHKSNEEQPQQPITFDVLLASDIIYARVIVEPLWETVQMLLSRTKEALFVMAYARRDVPVTIDMVLKHADECGFTHELVDEHPEGICVYIFRWKDV